MKSRGTTGTRYTTVEAVSVLYPIVPVSGIMPYCLQSCPILVVRTPCGPSCAVRYSQVSGRVPSNGEVLDPCCVYFFFFHLVVFFVFLRFGSFNFLYLRVVISTLFSFFAIAAFFSFSCPLLFLFLRCFAFSYFFSSFSVVDFFLCFFRFFVLYILISYPTFFFPCVSFSKGFKSNRGGGGSSFFFRKTLHEVLHLLSLHSAVCKNKQRLDFFYLARDSCGMMTCCYVDAPRHKQQVAFFPLEFLSGIEGFFFFLGGGGQGKGFLSTGTSGAWYIGVFCIHEAEEIFREMRVSIHSYIVGRWHRKQKQTPTSIFYEWSDFASYPRIRSWMEVDLNNRCVAVVEDYLNSRWHGLLKKPSFFWCFPLFLWL